MYESTLVYKFVGRLSEHLLAFAWWEMDDFLKKGLDKEKDIELGRFFT
jgi:hypothetical protein